MSDTMRDAFMAFLLEPAPELYDASNTDAAYIWQRAWQAAQSQPAPPVPSSVTEIVSLMMPYVRACEKYYPTPGEDIEAAGAEVQAAFKPLEAALTALVEKNHELKFELDGVNAMRRPEWISVDERLPEQRDYPYQVVAIAKKAHGKESCYPGEGIRRVQQDWVIRQWPQNFTHWMTLPPSSTPGIEPEQGESHE